MTPTQNNWPTAFLCSGHGHPVLPYAIRWEALLAELLELCHAVKGNRARGRYWAPLDRAHRRSQRRYAQVIEEDWMFEFSRAMLWLPKRFRMGILAHEVGHCLAPGDTEAEADAAAERAFGIRLRYDESWPGRGLQCSK